MSELPGTNGDAYIQYIQRFFRKWQGVYDAFALSIFPVYRAAVARAVPQPGITVLDVCTGTGEVARRCARRGARVTGIDISEPMLAHARRKTAGLPVHLERMDARYLPFENDHFDAAVISFALHDMPRRVRLEVLREVARVTRQRLVILDYHLPPGLLQRLWIRSIDLFETAYFRRFAEEGLDPLLEEAGLRVVERSRPGPWFAIRVIELDEAA